ncbi:MAG: flagellar hook-basal body complex protein FliE [Planctomycetota bacterium]
MVDSIKGSGAGWSNVQNALKRMDSTKLELGAKPSSTDTSEPAGFAEALQKGIGSVDAQVDRTNAIHVDVLEGRVDLHEVAAQLKESEITFQFALQVRNKLLDAYREVMRMSV